MTADEGPVAQYTAQATPSDPLRALMSVDWLFV